MGANWNLEVIAAHYPLYHEMRKSKSLQDYKKIWVVWLRGEDSLIIYLWDALVNCEILCIVA